MSQAPTIDPDVMGAMQMLSTPPAPPHTPTPDQDPDLAGAAAFLTGQHPAQTNNTFTAEQPGTPTTSHDFGEDFDTQQPQPAPPQSAVVFPQPPLGVQQWAPAHSQAAFVHPMPPQRQDFTAIGGPDLSRPDPLSSGWDAPAPAALPREQAVLPPPPPQAPSGIMANLDAVLPNIGMGILEGITASSPEMAQIKAQHPELALTPQGTTASLARGAGALGSQMAAGWAMAGAGQAAPAAEGLAAERLAMQQGLRGTAARAATTLKGTVPGAAFAEPMAVGTALDTYHANLAQTGDPKKALTEALIAGGANELIWGMTGSLSKMLGSGEAATKLLQDGIRKAIAKGFGEAAAPAFADHVAREVTEDVWRHNQHLDKGYILTLLTSPERWANRAEAAGTAGVIGAASHGASAGLAKVGEARAARTTARGDAMDQANAAIGDARQRGLNVPRPEEAPAQAVPTSPRPPEPPQPASSLQSPQVARPPEPAPQASEAVGTPQPPATPSGGVPTQPAPQPAVEQGGSQPSSGTKPTGRNRPGEPVPWAVGKSVMDEAARQRLVDSGPFTNPPQEPPSAAPATRPVPAAPAQPAPPAEQARPQGAAAGGPAGEPPVQAGEGGAAVQPQGAEPQAPREVAPAHDFSSTQVQMPDRIAGRAQALASKIKDEDLASDGREKDTHITVKYGLHTNDPSHVEALLKDQGPITLTLGKTSLFEANEASAQRGGEQYDVVKIDADSPDLHALNKKIGTLEHTDTHPVYKPHLTLAYVKAGKGAKYAGDASMEGQQIAVDTLVFSDKSGKRTEFKLTGKTAPTREQAEAKLRRANKTVADLEQQAKKIRDSGQSARDANRQLKVARGAQEAARKELTASWGSTAPQGEKPASERSGPRAEEPAANPGAASSAEPAPPQESTQAAQPGRTPTDQKTASSGSGASPKVTTPTGPRPFTRSDLESRIKDAATKTPAHDARTSQASIDEANGEWGQENADAGTLSGEAPEGAFTYHGRMPGELRNLTDGRPDLKKKLTRTDDPSKSGWQEHLANVGEARYKQQLEHAGRGMDQALDDLRQSPDPEHKFLAALHDNMPERGSGPVKESLTPADLPKGATFTINGEKFEVKEDKGGYLVLKDGKDYPVTPVDALREIPADKGSLKGGAPKPKEPPRPATQPPDAQDQERNPQGPKTDSKQKPEHDSTSKPAATPDLGAPVKEQAEAEPKPVADDKRVEHAAPPKPEPTAPPGEEPAPQSFGIKNAAAEIDRLKLGAGEFDAPARRGMEEMYAAGQEAAAKDTQAIPRLIQELRDDPEKIISSDTEAGLLLKHKVDLENALKDGIEAHQKAKGDRGAEAAAWANLQALRAQILELTDLTKRTGTASGRALAARNMMSRLDYSLSSMEARRAAAKGSPLTEAELASVLEEHKALKSALEVETKAKNAASDAASKAEHEAFHQRLLKEAAEEKLKTAKAGQPRRRRVDRFVGVLHSAADQARARIKARGVRLRAGLDPIELADYAIIGADHLASGIVKLADWSAKMIGEFGEAIKPHLPEIRTASEKDLEGRLSNQPDDVKARLTPKEPKAEKPKATTREKLKARAQEGAKPSELQPYLHRMALDLIRGGTTGREKLIDALHEQVKEAFPTITRQETRDALSGYGDFKPLDKEKAKARLREIKGESQKLAQLEALQNKQAPKATGMERQPPSDEARRLQKEVNEAKKAAGLTPPPGPGRLKTLLESTKTRIKNQIKDLQTELDTGTRLVRGKPTALSDPELDTLRTRLAALREAHDAAFKRPGLTDAQRLDLATRAAKKSAEAWEQRAKEAQRGNFAGKPRSARPSSPEIDAARARAEHARAEFEALKAADPAQQASEEARANAEYRARLAEQEADLKDRLARQDFAPRPAPERLRLDPASLKAKARVEEARQRFEEGNERAQRKNRPPVLKAADLWAKWRRNMVLSHISVLGKLAAAAGSRVLTSPAESLGQYAAGRILPALGSRASIPHSLKTWAKAEAAAQARFWTQGMRGSARMLRGKRTDMELAHGAEHLPPEVTEYLGRLHGALKNPTKEAAYARALEIETQHSLEAGEDATSPAVQMRNANRAYRAAEGEIFQEDNKAAEGFNGWLRQLESQDKETGKPQTGMVLASAMIRYSLPIIKVPLNYFRATTEVATGLPVGIARTIHAYAKGIDTLKPVEASAIMRQLSRGSIGAAFLLLGYFNPKGVGGYYQHGEKRDDGEAQAGGVRVFGHDVPRLLLHNPFLEAMHIGATIRRVADSRLHKKDQDQQGVGSGITAASLGLIDEIPFVKEGSTVGDLMDPLKRDHIVWREATSLVIPGAAEDIARWMDRRDGEAVKRKPTSLKESLESAVPGLRRRVPEAPEPGTRMR